MLVVVARVGFVVVGVGVGLVDFFFSLLLWWWWWWCGGGGDCGCVCGCDGCLL